METEGFYKLNGDLLFAPNKVISQKYILTKETYQEFEYPVDGWYWFNSEEEARIFFELPKKQIELNNII